MKVKEKNYIDGIRQNYKKAAAVLLLLLIGYLLLGNQLKAAIVISALVIAAALSTFYYNYFHGPINFELVKFSTIITSIGYGTWAGIAVGIITTILSRLWSGRIDHRTAISIIGITIVAAATTIPVAEGIAARGLLLVLLYHLITVPISISSGDSPAFTMTYAATNIGFNAVIFHYAGPVALAIIMP